MDRYFPRSPHSTKLCVAASPSSTFAVCPSYVKEIRFTMEIEVGRQLKFPVWFGVEEGRNIRGEGRMESDMNGINLRGEREKGKVVMTHWIRN